MPLESNKELKETSTTRRRKKKQRRRLEGRLLELSIANVTGDWSLQKFEELGPDGLTIKSHGDAKGLLIYTPGGRMSVSMYRVPDTENADILRNFVKDLFYAGTFRIEGQTIIHHAEVALHAVHREKDLPRLARLEEAGSLLILEALSIEGRVLGRIFWKRLR